MAQLKNLLVTGASRFINTINGNAASASTVLDSGNNTETTFAYSKSGLTSATWLAAWSGYELRAIAPANITAGNASKVNNHTVEKDVPSNAVFTDTNTHRPVQVNGTEVLGNNTTALNLIPGSNVSITNGTSGVTIAATNTTYESKAAASGGTAVSLVTTGEKYTWNSKGSGTITGIKMNGASKGTSGVVDLGTVITAHQDISGKADKSATVSTVSYDSTNKKLTKTINGTTSDIVTVATLKTALTLAKGDVGLGNVENKSSATIRGELTKANVTDALGYTPPTSDTNTHRPIQVNGTEVLGNNTTALNLKAGSNVTVTNSSGTVTIAATNTTYGLATLTSNGLMPFEHFGVVAAIREMANSTTPSVTFTSEQISNLFTNFGIGNVATLVYEVIE